VCVFPPFARSLQFAFLPPSSCSSFLLLLLLLVLRCGRSPLRRPHSVRCHFGREGQRERERDSEERPLEIFHRRWIAVDPVETGWGLGRTQHTTHRGTTHASGVIGTGSSPASLGWTGEGLLVDLVCLPCVRASKRRAPCRTQNKQTYTKRSTKQGTQNLDLRARKSTALRTPSAFQAWRAPRAHKATDWRHAAARHGKRNRQRSAVRASHPLIPQWMH